MKLSHKYSIVSSFLLCAMFILTLSSCTDEDEKDVINPIQTIPTISSENKVLSFKLTFESDYPVPVTATIDETSKKISTSVGIDESKRGYNLRGKATVMLSSKATILPDPSLIRDYSDPVVYTVTAEDGSEQEYVVEVFKLKMKITSINKTTFEPGERIILYGENFVANEYANNFFLIEDGAEYQLFHNDGNKFSTTQFVIHLHEQLEVGEYTLKIRAYDVDSIEYDVPITVDFSDRSSKITYVSTYKSLDNTVDPPLYVFSFSTAVRFLGASTDEQVSDAKVYLIDASDENTEHLCARKNYSWSSKYTYFGVSSIVPNSVAPGQYYVEVEYDGIRTRYSEQISFPW